MFAAWEAGVWKALETRFRPDMVVGTSAGALNAWAIAGGASAADLAREWLDPRMAGIMHPGLHSTGCLLPEVLFEKAREMYDRYRPKIPFGLTVAELPRLRLRLVREAGITWRHLAATCSIPFGFPPVEIDGHRYVDGGVGGALPLWAAAEMGATRAIAVNALTNLPFRMMKKVIGRRLAAPADVLLIEPSITLGSLRDAVVWSAENVARWIEQGERDANRAVPSITM
jgi:NTE family protein